MLKGVGLKRHHRRPEIEIPAQQPGRQFEIRSTRKRYSDLQIRAPEWAESVPRREGVMVTGHGGNVFFLDDLGSDDICTVGGGDNDHAGALCRRRNSTAPMPAGRARRQSATVGVVRTPRDLSEPRGLSWRTYVRSPSWP